MALSDEEAYRQGKRIAQDMMKGSYEPSKDYSDKKTPPLWAVLVGLAGLAGVIFLIWKFGF